MWQIRPYTDVSELALKDNSRRIGQLRNEEIVSALADYLEHQFHFRPELSGKMRIERSDLLGEPGACVAMYLEEPIMDPDGSPLAIAGKAVLLDVGEHSASIPLAIIAPHASPSILEHEKIHLCQYILKNGSPFSQQQLALSHHDNLVQGIDKLLQDGGEASACDFLVRYTCYKVWTEFEAYWFSATPRCSYDELVARVVRSARPMATLENGLQMIQPPLEVGRECLRNFEVFCSTTLSAIDWLLELRGERQESLHDDLHFEEENLGLEEMFGSLDDE